MKGNIIDIRNTSPVLTEIDIEGIIGIPEQWQFENEDNRVATYEKFQSELRKIDEVSSPEVVVNIRSTGGNVNDALLIYDALTALDASITTKCYGYTASAATIIAQAADKGQRRISSNALYLIHKSISASEGNAKDISETVDMLEKTDQRIASIYAGRSGRTAEEFMELMGCNGGNGKWLSPEEAMKAGLVDAIISVEEETCARRAKRTTGKNNRRNFAIRQHWNAILEVIGIGNTKGRTAKGPDDTEIEWDENSKRKPARIEVNDKERIVKLQNQVRMQEIDNIRTGALQTKTEPAEDPSPTEVKLSQNAISYEEDVRSFIN